MCMFISNRQKRSVENCWPRRESICTLYTKHNKFVAETTCRGNSLLDFVTSAYKIVPYILSKCNNISNLLPQTVERMKKKIVCVFVCKNEMKIIDLILVFRADFFSFTEQKIQKQMCNDKRCQFRLQLFYVQNGNAFCQLQLSLK